MSTARFAASRSRLRSAVGWLRQMRSALEIGAPQTGGDADGRAHQIDRAVNRLRAFGIDPRL